MSAALNILAIALMLVMPFLRPCGCAGFSLFCECRAVAEASQHCCGHGCTSTPADQPEPSPDSCPGKHEPCGKTLAPDSVVAYVIADGANVVEHGWHAVAPTFSVFRRPGFVPVPVVRPPPLASVVVAQTHFLRI